ncbi:hypothetical protein FJQ98_12935 [Lysinibacillus agricola]|uniref:Uncharacterized protein n=1 Tax=Lysinibacillus agricola TaxID=2590012 RepID=A0ABX7ALX8_9BACI|nr:MULTISPECIES: hypothetical protein [Lysinibacillus]KOS64126.1 hypothetical protein AN161_03725 [Lysinibacillus sp. FJAT-14222]QQP10217.1 hypothetical protein FJQ98_12935 [Lysinibacillus agricola]
MSNKKCLKEEFLYLIYVKDLTEDTVQSDTKQPFDITPGSNVPIELSINTKGELDFIVNYGVKKTFNNSSLTTSDGITNARVVIGACDQDYNI